MNYLVSLIILIGLCPQAQSASILGCIKQLEAIAANPPAKWVETISKANLSKWGNFAVVPLGDRMDLDYAHLLWRNNNRLAKTSKYYEHDSFTLDDSEAPKGNHPLYDYAFAFNGMIESLVTQSSLPFEVIYFDMGKVKTGPFIEGLHIHENFVYKDHIIGYQDPLPKSWKRNKKASTLDATFVPDNLGSIVRTPDGNNLQIKPGELFLFNEGTPHGSPQVQTLRSFHVFVLTPKAKID